MDMFRTFSSIARKGNEQKMKTSKTGAMDAYMVVTFMVGLNHSR